MGVDIIQISSGDGKYIQFVCKKKKNYTFSLRHAFFFFLQDFIFTKPFVIVFSNLLVTSCEIGCRDCTPWYMRVLWPR